jgi:hypothetical protein
MVLETTAVAKPATPTVDPGPDPYGEKENIPAAPFLAARTGIAQKTSQNSAIEPHQNTFLDEDPNAARRKRQKSTDPDPEAAAQPGAAARLPPFVQASIHFIPPQAVQVVIPPLAALPPIGLFRSDTSVVTGKPAK